MAWPLLCLSHGGRPTHCESCHSTREFLCKMLAVWLMHSRGKNSYRHSCESFELQGVNSEKKFLPSSCACLPHTAVLQQLLNDTKHICLSHAVDLCLRKNDPYCQFSNSIPFLEILLFELKKLLEIYCRYCYLYGYFETVMYTL